MEGVEPPKALGRVVGPVLKALLCSPLHGLVSEHLMRLAFAGRKSGKRYEVVVGCHDLGGTLAVPTGSRWRSNLRGGAPVEAPLDSFRDAEGEERRSYHDVGSVVRKTCS